MTTNKDENGLLPCPFCKSGETRIDEQSFWTGMRSQVISVSVRHWCPKNPLQSYVEVKAKTREEAVKTWNTRPQQSQSGDVQLALDALNDAEECFQPETLEELRKHFGTIRAALTAQQSDVNQWLLKQTIAKYQHEVDYLNSIKRTEFGDDALRTYSIFLKELEAIAAEKQGA